MKMKIANEYLNGLMERVIARDPGEPEDVYKRQTLALLGGGTLAAGGGGMAAGAAALGAATLGVGLLVGGIIFSFTGGKMCIRDRGKSHPPECQRRCWRTSCMAG